MLPGFPTAVAIPGPTAGKAESCVRAPEGALRGPNHPPYLRGCPIITN